MSVFRKTLVDPGFKFEKITITKVGSHRHMLNIFVRETYSEFHSTGSCTICNDAVFGVVVITVASRSMTTGNCTILIYDWFDITGISEAGTVTVQRPKYNLMV